MTTMVTRYRPGPGWHAKHITWCVLSGGLWAPGYWLAYKAATRVRSITTTAP